MENNKETQQKIKPYTAADPTIEWEEDKEEFRDRLSTITEEGKRRWIYPKKPKGRFYNWRTYLSWILLAILFGLPFIKIDGHPFILLNILERKFILFGLAFWPQDFHLVVLALLSLILFVVLFTSIFGRLWCGWACPQTIFMEMVFRKIEYLIEGDFHEQRKLNSEPWHLKKIFKKGLKLGIFYFISFIIANTFLAYIIGIDELWKIIREPIKDHLFGFITINLFTFVFFMVYARFREQVCHIVCPYGRFQSVLVDNDTIAVTYDFKRGEPRAKLSERKNSEKNFGDCIDCGLCVKVCPAGIDIRNGIQLECIQCTACIDACDSVMDGIGKPRGLIRYTSYNGITQGYKIKTTWRTYAYAAVLAILLTTFFTLLITRPDTETTFLRQRGTLYQTLPSGEIANIYQYKIVNKTFKTMEFDFKMVNPANATLQYIDPIKPLASQSIFDGRLFIAIKPEDITKNPLEIKLELWANGEKKEELSSTFVSPEKNP